MGFTCLLALICILNFHQFLRAENLDTYIVHVDPAQSEDLDTWYDSFMPTTTAANVADASTNYDNQPRILHRYRNVFSGFAAKLSAADIEAMRQKKGFVSARRERVLPLHTTHSPNFLGLNQNMGLWKNSSYGKGVIIGMVDVGLQPNHPSFSDAGMPLPPPKWKGKCQFTSGNGTACNNKLIGARFFTGKISPVPDGHGTHTASTAAGNFVGGAEFFGNANGTAVGIAPLAHLSIYQACDSDGCPTSAVAAAIDAAIDDGVDIISLSLGGGFDKFSDDVVSIGAHRAMERGIVVSCAAGNDGNIAGSVSNGAPWIITVGASTIDRKITATAVLGNGEEIHGETGTGFPSVEKLALVYPRPFFPGVTACLVNFKIDVRGKIVVCDNGTPNSRVDKGEVVKKAGGAAMILVNTFAQGDTTFDDAYALPHMQIGYADGLKLKEYLNSNSNPTATMSFNGTVIGGGQAPVVAAFSSRGPNAASPGILKPDIIGPGVNILAAWPFYVENKTDTKSTFNIISGTSMSCPHLTGVAALLKSLHPDWSPAVIKSAIMTTADQVNHDGNPIENEQLKTANVFAIGSGHVNPSRANDPGLVYDIMPDDYIPYLCGLNYTNQEIGIIVNRKEDCSKVKSIPEGQLNYPSFSIILGSTPQTYTRTLTNVGKADSSFEVEIISPDNVVVNVEPKKLVFPKLGDKLSYNVTFSARTTKIVVTNRRSSQGSIKWNSGVYSVRSPIAVVFKSE